jgi:hypothetical protein
MAKHVLLKKKISCLGDIPKSFAYFKYFPKTKSKKQEIRAPNKNEKEEKGIWIVK